MHPLYTAALQLWHEAFPGEDKAFTSALFDLGFPDHFRYIEAEGELVCMLFALPYPIVTQAGTVDARYLYAVATAKAHRGKGYAKQLIAKLMAEPYPVFLRPMSPSLFDFYRAAGLSPLSPHGDYCGFAQKGEVTLRHLTPEEYLVVREQYLTPPFARMTPAFLSLAYLDGGAVTDGASFAGLFEHRGELVLFKEWWGDTALAPAAAAALGAKRFCVRFPLEGGAPFGMGHGLDPQTVFLAALD